VVAAILAQVVALVADLHIRDSQQALAAGNPTRARAEALAAKMIEPCAASSYLQLAFVDQDVRNYARADMEIQAALERSHRDRQIWLIPARIDTQDGRIAAARCEYQEAERLNSNAASLPLCRKVRNRVDAWNASDRAAGSLSISRPRRPAASRLEFWR
jgi:tetratricopeptide (TPR) repeat protein